MNTVPIACAALDGANATDPKKNADGRADALRYADGISRWVQRLIVEPSPELLIAARGQHLERWVIPRASFPEGKAGYFRWRKAVQVRQGERVCELLRGLVDDGRNERVAMLVAKAVPAGDPEAQALEDAACLVFLEQEIAGFAAAHGDYTAEHYITILRKTWVKMSPQAQDLARGLHLEQPFADLVKAALDMAPVRKSGGPEVRKS